MRRFAITLVGWLCAAAVAAHAQQGTAEIAGKVADAQGGVLPGVTIVATNEATGLYREVTTSAAGTYFPGIQFAASNQMGNDTIVASVQTSQNSNVSVDGGCNGDDALGTSSGAQVRTPLEAIQEFQVLTSMYDAEYGRASGYNITHRANFENPVAANRDMRTASTFLVLTNLYGGGGFPRQAQVGARFAF